MFSVKIGTKSVPNTITNQPWPKFILYNSGIYMHSSWRVMVHKTRNGPLLEAVLSGRAIVDRIDGIYLGGLGVFVNLLPGCSYLCHLRVGFGSVVLASLCSFFPQTLADSILGTVTHSH